jgi:hypothetical protein
MMASAIATAPAKKRHFTLMPHSPFRPYVSSNRGASPLDSCSLY